MARTLGLMLPLLAPALARTLALRLACTPAHALTGSMIPIGSRLANYGCVAGATDGAVKRHDATSLKLNWSCTLASAIGHVDCLAANPRAPSHLVAAVSDQSQPSSAILAHFDMRAGGHGALYER